MQEPLSKRREAADLHFRSLPPLSLYVHLPWCIRKCPYCDFNSYEARGVLPEAEYVEALLRDLDAEARSAQQRPLQSVFIGGGTPSLFSAGGIARLLAGLRARLPLSEVAEITLEANPGAVEAERFAGFRAAGVNRLSIGIQSFRDPKLRALGRVHDAAEARRAFALAREAGFDDINLDLMYALPSDDAAGALSDLEQALQLSPTHLSWYQLTLEPSTAFARRPPPLPDEDVVAEIEQRGRAMLADAGFRRYEISAYAQDGRRCAHNLNYWGFGDYIGIGAGAHGKLTLPSEQAIERRAKTRNPRTFVQQAGTDRAVSVERVTEARQAAIEFLLNALRLTNGVSEASFSARAGQPAARLDAARRTAVDRGWLAEEPGQLRATAAGLQVLNRLLELFA